MFYDEGPEGGQGRVSGRNKQLNQSWRENRNNKREERKEDVFKTKTLIKQEWGRKR